MCLSQTDGKKCCYNQYVTVYSSINRPWFHNHWKYQIQDSHYSPAPPQPTDRHQVALLWGGRGSHPPAATGEGALTVLLGASDGCHPMEPSHTWPGHQWSQCRKTQNLPSCLAAAMLPSVPQSPCFTVNRIKNRTEKEFAAFVLPRVIMTAVHLTLSSFSSGERSSTILAWTRLKNCL